MGRKHAVGAVGVRPNEKVLLQAARKQGKMLLGDLFVGDQFAGLRHDVVKNGLYKHENGRELHVRTRPLEGTAEHEILSIAAVSRDPGRSDDWLTSAIADYQIGGKTQALKVDLFWQVYHNEGIINNAANSLAAIIGSSGEFRIRSVKKGKKQKPEEVAKAILDYFHRNVNQAAKDAVVTGARGLPAVTHRVVRQALVEGSWVGRSVWTPCEVGTWGRFDLPMNVQSISTKYIEPVKGLEGTPVEGFYWVPPKALINQLTSPTDKDAAKLLKKFVPTDMITRLKKDGKVLLDPSLILHVRHRGTDFDAFGESMIESAMVDIMYRRSVDQLDLVSMQNLINRLVIVMVGSSDPKSPYSKPEVAAARTAVMQSMFAEPGPNMTIIWQGDDVQVKDVGAYSAVLDLTDRHTLADGRIKLAVGVPEALLQGTASTDKAAGWAAVLAASAKVGELRNQIAQTWRTLGERILTENGFTDIDLTYEFDQTAMMDKSQERNLNRQDYVAGVLSIRSQLLATGRDPDAEFLQKCFERGLDPENTTWSEAFTAPQGLQGQGPGKVPGAGRPTDDQSGKTTPERPPKNTPVENR